MITGLFQGHGTPLALLVVLLLVYIDRDEAILYVGMGCSAVHCSENTHGAY